jgi:hypothetical protein
MALLSPPQTIARAGKARVGGCRAAFMGTSAGTSPWTILDPIAGVPVWTVIGGERRIVDEYDEV